MQSRGAHGGRNDNVDLRRRSDLPKAVFAGEYFGQGNPQIGAALSSFSHPKGTEQWSAEEQGDVRGATQSVGAQFSVTVHCGSAPLVPAISGFCQPMFGPRIRRPENVVRVWVKVWAR